MIEPLDAGVGKRFDGTLGLVRKGDAVVAAPADDHPTGGGGSTLLPRTVRQRVSATTVPPIPRRASSSTMRAPIELPTRSTPASPWSAMKEPSASQRVAMETSPASGHGWRYVRAGYVGVVHPLGAMRLPRGWRLPTEPAPRWPRGFAGVG